MAGWVYVLSTSTHPLLKIGFTDGNPIERARQLSDTSSPDPYILEYALKVSDARSLERLVHEKLSGYRHTDNREFFNSDLIATVESVRSSASAFPVLDEMYGGIVPPSDEWRCRHEQELIAQKKHNKEIRLEKLEQRTKEIALLKQEDDTLKKVKKGDIIYMINGEGEKSRELSLQNILRAALNPEKAQKILLRLKSGETAKVRTSPGRDLNVICLDITRQNRPMPKSIPPTQIDKERKVRNPSANRKGVAELIFWCVFTAVCFILLLNSRN